MIMKFLSAAMAVAIAAGLSWQPARAEPNGVKAGFLTCDEGSGWGFVFGSTRDLKCTYTDVKDASERYIDISAISTNSVSTSAMCMALWSPGRCSLRQSTAQRAPWLAPILAQRSARAGVPICWSAAPTSRSRCSP